MLRKYKGDEFEIFVEIYSSRQCINEDHKVCQFIFKYESREDAERFVYEPSSIKYVWDDIIIAAAAQVLQLDILSPIFIRAKCKCECHAKKI